MFRIPLGRVSLALFAFAAVGLSNAAAASTPADYYVSPSGSNASSCTAAAPCLTLDRAYHLAAPGQVVELSSGLYAAQKLTYDATKVGANASVTFRAASGTLAALAGLTLDGAQHVTVLGNSPNSNLVRLGALQKPTDGITLRTDPTTMDTGGNLMVQNCANNNTFRNLDMQQFGISGSDGTVIDGGSVGGYDNNGGDSFVGNPAKGTAWCLAHNPLNTHITHLVFHDVLRTNLPSAHPDCLQFYGSDGVVVDYNTFARCATSHIMDRPSFVGSVEDHQVFDHNLLGPLVEGGNTIAAGATTDVMGSVTISNNVCAATCFSNMGATYRSFTVTGNWWGYLSRYGCQLDIAKVSLMDSNQFGIGQYLCGARSSVVSTQPDPFNVPDTAPPTAPGTISLDAFQASSVTFSWSPAIDNVAVAGYSVYLDGSKLATVSGTSTTVSGLAWGAHALAVEAYDAAGNVSPQVQRSITSSWG